jgi:hypothetical protein
MSQACRDRNWKDPPIGAGLAITPRSTTIGRHWVTEWERMPRFGWYQISRPQRACPLDRKFEGENGDRATVWRSNGVALQ